MVGAVSPDKDQFQPVASTLSSVPQALSAPPLRFNCGADLLCQAK
jgi:hypothetical protein